MEVTAPRPEARAEGLLALAAAFQPFKRANSEHIAYLGRASKLVIASDYSGSHAGSAYDAYSALVLDYDRCDDWVERRYAARQHHLPDMRRMSFKSLGDSQKRRALMPFLEAASSAYGVTLTLLVDKRTSQCLMSRGCGCGLRTTGGCCGNSEPLSGCYE
jgi:hypothetical protein